MTLRAFAVCMFGALALPAFAQEAALDVGKPITVEQALEIAFRSSPEIYAALDQIEKAKAGEREARANFMPKLTAEAQHQRLGPIASIEFTNPITGQKTEITAVTPQNTKLTGSAYLPLDVSRRISHATGLAKYQLDLQQLSLQRTAQKLILDVKKAYYNLLRAAAQQETVQASVDVAAARLKDTSAKYAVGTVPKFDVTRSQVELANLNQSLIQAKNGVAIARASLNRTLGIDVNAPTVVAQGEIEIQDIKTDVPGHVQQAFSTRPEIKSAQLAIELAKKNVRLQRTGVLPSFGLAGAYVYETDPSSFSEGNTSWSAIASVSMPVWDGGVTKARVDQAYADVDAAKQALEQAKLGVSLEVKVAVLNLQEAAERVSTAGESVTLAEEALRLANVRYDAGLSTLVEVTDAESALTLARFNLVNAKYDYAIAAAELQRATATQPEFRNLELIGSARASGSRSGG